MVLLVAMVIRVIMVIMVIRVIWVIMVIRLIRVIMIIRVIRVIRVTSVKSSIGILTHQGHISKVNANAYSVSKSVTNITSIASCDAKKRQM